MSRFVGTFGRKESAPTGVRCSPSSPGWPVQRAVHGLSTLARMSSTTRGQKRKLLAAAALATVAADVDYASAAQICDVCQLQHSVFTGATADGLLQHAIQALGSQFVCTGRVPLFFPDTWVEMELATGVNSAAHLGEWDSGNIFQFRERYKRLGREHSDQFLSNLHVYAENWKGDASQPGGQTNWWIIGQCPNPIPKRASGAFDVGRPLHTADQQLKFCRLLHDDPVLLWQYTNCREWAEKDVEGVVQMPQWLGLLKTCIDKFGALFALYTKLGHEPTRKYSMCTVMLAIGVHLSC